MRVLIVDDHAPARKLIARCLAPLSNVEIHEATSLTEARQVLSRQLIDVALVDLRLDDKDSTNRDGLSLVRELRERGSAIPIVVTASSDMSEVRKAMRFGAYAYILKEELCEELVLPVLAELQGKRALEREVLHLHGLVGSSPPMERLRRQLKKVAAVDMPVLVLGPTGSGKELVARAIHALSPRRDHPLVSVNCSGFTETLVESQLFGHEKGAFTSADKAREGLLAEARRGTLFLDEIAELPSGAQAKLLRALENRTYRAIGASTDSHFEGRVIAATHVNLSERMAQSSFRQDLYYRLEVLTVQVPPLNERKEDIPALVEHFAKETPRHVRFSEHAVAALKLLDWLGNVRQLRNVIHRLAVFSERDVITEDDVEHNRRTGSGVSASENPLGLQTVGAELLRGLSAHVTKKDNSFRLAKNQVRILEADGVSSDEICRIMDIGRTTFFRIKNGSG